jgi:hypothetical protein
MELRSAALEGPDRIRARAWAALAASMGRAHDPQLAANFAGYALGDVIALLGALGERDEEIAQLTRERDYIRAQYDKEHAALERSVKLQSHYAALFKCIRTAPRCSRLMRPDGWIRRIDRSG